MKTNLISLILLVTSLAPLSAFKEEEHNKQMLQVLFGRPYTINENEQRNIVPLEYALYLCIDMYNGEGGYNEHRDGINGKTPSQKLKALKDFGVKNLPDIKVINFTAGSNHQKYTHMGWDYSKYPKDEYNKNNPEFSYQQIWNIRQQGVLLATIDKIFRFKGIFGYRQDEVEKRDSFAALLYYVHVLGDHIGDSKGTYTDRIPISPHPDYRDNRSGENSHNPTIYTELLYHLPRLFKEQTNSVDYGMLMRYLERNKNRQFSTGTTISDKEYAELQTFAKETLDKLREYIPRLLRNEDFFLRVFFK